MSNPRATKRARANSAGDANPTSRVITFDHESREVWREINIAYRHLSGSKQYDIAFDVADNVGEIIKHIVKQCELHPNPETRYNALSALRKIGKTICLSSNDVVGHEVQKQFQWDPALEDGMTSIIDMMTPDERWNIRCDLRGPDAIWPKLEELEDLANSFCVFDGLANVLNILDEDPEDKDEEECDDEDEVEDKGESDYEEDDEEGENGSEDVVEEEAKDILTKGS